MSKTMTLQAKDRRDNQYIPPPSISRRKFMNELGIVGIGSLAAYTFLNGCEIPEEPTQPQLIGRLDARGPATGYSYSIEVSEDPSTGGLLGSGQIKTDDTLLGNLNINVDKDSLDGVAALPTWVVIITLTLPLLFCFVSYSGCVLSAPSTCRPGRVASVSASYSYSFLRGCTVTCTITCQHIQGVGQ